jgi:DNA-binding NarL/FixJ family response regulator
MLAHPPLIKPIRVAFVSTPPLWAEVCQRALESLPRGIKVTVIDDTSLDQLQAIKAIRPNVIVLSPDNPLSSLTAIRSLREAGCAVAMLVLSPRCVLPTFEELASIGVQGIVSSRQSLSELESSIYSLASGQPDSLEQQYLRATNGSNHVSSHSDRAILNDREKQILELVGRDLTDHEIADHLHLSHRTVSNHLRYIYAKLGVRGRAGAATIALAKGLIHLDI